MRALHECQAATAERHQSSVGDQVFFTHSFNTSLNNLFGLNYRSDPSLTEEGAARNDTDMVRDGPSFLTATSH